jgi:hypothetical protein
VDRRRGVKEEVWIEGEGGEGRSVDRREGVKEEVWIGGRGVKEEVWMIVGIILTKNGPSFLSRIILALHQKVRMA